MEINTQPFKRAGFQNRYATLAKEESLKTNVYVHEGSIAHLPKLGNTARSIVENGEIHHYIKLQNKENAFCLPHKPFLEGPLFAYS